MTTKLLLPFCKNKTKLGFISTRRLRLPSMTKVINKSNLTIQKISRIPQHLVSVYEDWLSLISIYTAQIQHYFEYKWTKSSYHFSILSVNLVTKLLLENLNVWGNNFSVNIQNKISILSFGALKRTRKCIVS